PIHDLKSACQRTFRLRFTCVRFSAKLRFPCIPCQRKAQSAGFNNRLTFIVQGIGGHTSIFHNKRQRQVTVWRFQFLCRTPKAQATKSDYPKPFLHHVIFLSVLLLSFYCLGNAPCIRLFLHSKTKRFPDYFCSMLPP